MPNRMNDIPWSALSLVLTIHREGSLRAAAKALRISHPTVSRRIDALQADLGVRLFEREGRRLRLTLAGEDLAQTAARVEAEVNGLGHRIMGRDHRLEGDVRVTLSPSMLVALAPAFPSFASQYPGIDVEWVTGLDFASLTRREADIAIRLTHSPHDTLVGRRLSLFETAAYVHTSLAHRMTESGQTDPHLWPWVDWDVAHQHHASAQWIREHLSPSQIVMRCDNSLTMYHVVKSGVGVGYVPTMLATHDDTLRPIGSPDRFPVFHRDIWVLTHADLKHVGRVRATVDWLCAMLAKEDGGVWTGIARRSPMHT